jgi:hypothetical protein
MAEMSVVPRSVFNAAVPMLLGLAVLTAGCAGGAVPDSDSPGTVTTGPDAGASRTETALPTSSPPSASAEAIDLDLDACVLLDVATVQSLTGEATDYTTSGQRSPSGSSCFWGATSPGFPGYVELRLFRQTSLANYSYGKGCAKSPVDGVGSEAEFAACPPDPQDKYYLLAFESGVIVSLLVNEPASPLTAEDLAPVAESVWEQLR